MNTANRRKHPILILIRGLPGSGKSHLAAELQKVIGRDDVLMLDPDATDYDSPAYLTHAKTLTAEGVDPKLHAYRFLRAQAYRGIEEHKVIIWNQPFTNRGIFDKMTAGLRAYAADYGTDLKIIVVDVDIDPEVARARLLARKAAGGHGPSAGRFDQFVRDFTSYEDSYDTIHVDGAADTAASVKTIATYL